MTTVAGTRLMSPSPQRRPRSPMKTFATKKLSSKLQQTRTSSRHRFNCIDFLSFDLGGGLCLPLSSSSRTARLTKARPAKAVTSHPPISKWSRRATRNTAGAAGSAVTVAGVAVTGVLGNGEHAPPGGSAEAGVLATGRGWAMTASAPHPGAQPRPGRRRWGYSKAASAELSCPGPTPGRWLRKGGASRTGSQVHSGAGWPLAAGRWESRRDFGGREQRLEMISWLA